LQGLFGALETSRRGSNDGPTMLSAAGPTFQPPIWIREHSTTGRTSDVDPAGLARQPRLRRQLALYVERSVKPRRIGSITRIALTVLSGFFDWRDALVVVRPQTLIRWHRAGWKLFGHLKSRPVRPPIPAELQALIRRIANENPSWDEQCIATELLLKVGIQVSPRTVNKYLPRRPRGDLRWSTFLHLHAQGIVACDSFDTVGTLPRSDAERPLTG
jgi:hypothetical protein